MSKNNESWAKIYDDLGIAKHDFNNAPFPINAEQIKRCVKDFAKTSQKEVRVLCKQDSREDRPQIFIDNELFILPIKNGEYIICKGEGYVDIPPITTQAQDYTSKLDFELKSSKVGDSEMQHLDFAYASSLIRTFLGDDSLVLSIRGRKYTPQFSFHTNAYQNISVVSVQTEVDSGFEGRDKIVLVEAKNSHTSNVIIRQLYYPMRQWSIHTQKQVITLFFEKRENEFWLWEFGFSDIFDYNSIFCKNSARFRIV
ncbi:type II restriction enzyme [Helicobacter sp. 23-1048]